MLRHAVLEKPVDASSVCACAHHSTSCCLYGRSSGLGFFFFFTISPASLIHIEYSKHQNVFVQ